MIPESTIAQTVKDLFDNIEFTAEPAGLYDPLRYMISIGGKRLRPRLCLTAYSLYKDSIGEDVLEPAAALEVFHTFTLIHDDIMDKSPMRRGKPTVWTKWNEDTAILSGDVMSIDSYRRLVKAPRAVLDQVLGLFSKTAAQVCEGQQYDMDFENVRQVPMDDYMKMIGLKTAVLLACSAKMGAIIGGASSEEADLLYEYGYQLGLAFQVADDYLDTYGDSAVFGKPIGGDIVNNKKSWLLTHAMEKTSDIYSIYDVMRMPVDTEEQRAAKIAAMREIYDACEIGGDAKAEIVRLNGLALAAASRLDITAEGHTLLRNFADALVGRAK
ncbi:MAG: polyprenyl synthetase family protein [Bacteroidales bacterium]|nr:polyprenyl synthetase family protein [Candidatus Cryptobacteroides onthequi]MCQ2164155.1 polyprenyl synthetase family protein [Bacteroidales bacterium]